MDDLCTIVQLAFKGEQVPTDMVLGEFLMVWKGKASKEECAQYRPIVLEEVACKLISSLMLVRLPREVGESRIDFHTLMHTLQQEKQEATRRARSKTDIYRIHRPDSARAGQPETTHTR